MTEQRPWHEAYPAPRNQQPDSITRDDLLGRFQGGQKAGVDFILVDLRRTDHEGGTIRGSLNLPAQSLYHTLPTLFNLCQRSGISLVIWYCGSSRGRGTRAAGWFDDLLQDRSVSDIRSVILLGGVSGWAKAGSEYVELMDEYDARIWRQV